MGVDMDFTEKTISTKKIFEGKIVNLCVDTVTLPNGKTATRELIKHPGGVGIAAVDENRNVLLVKQYRKPFDRIVTEIPAGKLEYGEEPMSAAMRELEEETGYKAGKMTPIGVFYSSPGFCDEKLHLYLATELVEVGQHLDEDEFLNVEKKNLDDAVKELTSDTESDGKTAIALLLAKQILG